MISSFTHSAVVETKLGAGRFGATFAAPVTVPVFRDDATVLDRSQSRDDVSAHTKLYAANQYEATFSVGSRVTINGRTSFVMTCNLATPGALVSLDPFVSVTLQ